MAIVIKMEVKESIKDLHQALKKSSALIQPRIKMLLEIKKSTTPLSKIKLATLVGVDPNSITTWRKKYREHGYESLLKHKRRVLKINIGSDIGKGLKELYKLIKKSI